MMKRNGGYSVIALLGLAVLSNSFYNHLIIKDTGPKKMSTCSSRDLASIKSIKINNKILKDLNNKLEKIDLQIQSKSKTQNGLKELGVYEEEIIAIKKEVESYKTGLLEKNLEIELAISGIEGQLNFKLDPEIEKVLTKKSEGLSEEKKKELMAQVVLKKKEKELLDSDISESNLVLENIENLNLTLNDYTKTLENNLRKKINNKEQKEEKNDDNKISLLEEQLCTKEEKVKELEIEIKELIKDKEDIAKVINRKKINSEKEEKENEIVFEKSSIPNNGNNSQGNAQIQMMLQQTSLMMQAMQMQQMRASMQPLYTSNPFQQDQQKFLYGNQLLAEMQLAQQLGRGIVPNAMNAPITNNYYYGQGNNAFSSPFSSLYGGAPMTGLGLGLGGQMPFNTNPFSQNFSNSPINLMPIFPRGQAGGGAFFNFGQTPNNI